MTTTDKKTAGVMPTRNDCNCTTLRKATRRISQLYDVALAPCGLKTTQRAILSQIERSKPVSVGALAEALVMDSGALAHTLRPLERDGFVAVEVDPGDRRHRLISLTAQGQAKLAESNVLWRKAQAGFDAAFGRPESQVLRDMLELLLADDFAVGFEAGMKGH